jgi:hypothetical protein
MAEYQVFTIGRDGHFISFRKFSCMDDADAVVWAKQLIDLYRVELWCGDRLVTRLDPEAGEAVGKRRCSSISITRQFAPIINRLGELEPFLGNLQPRLFVERAYCLLRLLTGFLGVLAEPVCAI